MKQLNVGNSRKRNGEFLWIIASCIFGIFIVLLLMPRTSFGSEESKMEERFTKVDPNHLSIGVQAGLNISNAATAPVTNSSNRTGFKVGALVEAPVLPGFFYVQPELNFLQKGAENTHFGTMATSSLNYLELPLLAKIKFKISSVKPFVLAGPSVAYLLSGNVDGPGLSAGRDRFSNLDFSFGLGGGVNFPLGDGPRAPEAFFAGRYTFALANVDRSTESWKSYGLQMTGGIQF